jgi:DNA polymerase III epsilon subunit-like protein
MKYFIDTEFFERPPALGHALIDLISIGIVAGDGREYYVENSEFDWRWVRHLAKDLKNETAQWLLDHVAPHVTGRVQLPGRIGYDILGFVGDDTPEFWAYYADYDWVIFCSLFGCMIDLPEHFLKYCMDLKQWAVQLGNPELPKQMNTEHNALADARWNREVYAFLCESHDTEAP